MKQHQHYRIVILLTCMTSLLVSIASGKAIATEVYRWTDANGVVHYGDKPPDGQKAQIINVRETQPDAASNAVVKGDADGPETSPPQSVADATREKIAKDRKERREKQAEMDRMCAKHRELLAGIEPHRRVFYMDESGERVRMDDDKRIALVEETKDFIAKNCD
jgi:hypothetical protein